MIGIGRLNESISIGLELRDQVPTLMDDELIIFPN